MFFSSFLYNPSIYEVGLLDFAFFPGSRISTSKLIFYIPELHGRNVLADVGSKGIFYINFFDDGFSVLDITISDMKYNIHIPQREAIMISEDLDILDMSIFDFIQYFSSTHSCHKLYEDDLVYFWIAYDLIIDEMPLLKIKTKDAIYRRIQKLVSVDLLVPHSENQKMGKTYFRFGDAFSGLYSDRPSDEKSEGVRMKSRRGTDEKPKGGTDEKSDKEEHHIEDNHNKTIYSVFEFWNSQKVIEHQMSPSIKKQIEKTLKIYSEDIIKKGIKNYADIIHSPRTFFHYKWTLSEFLSRDKGLAVFIDKTEEHYLTDTKTPFVSKSTEIKKSEDAKIRSDAIKKKEEEEVQETKKENDRAIAWYKTRATQEQKTEILDQIENHIMLKSLSKPNDLDKEEEKERKTNIIDSTRRMLLPIVIKKYLAQK